MEGILLTPEKLRDGIFGLNTRRFGTVAEVMVKRLVNLSKGRSQFHDLYDDLQNHRVEVKFSTVRKKSPSAITESNVLQSIEDELSENRQVPFSKWKNFEFDCNIQQIKKAEFDILYYGLFFYDQIFMFKINSKDIGSQIFYSDKQHKGNLGEGQFHINNKTLEIHLNNYLYQNLSYHDFLVLLK